MKKSYRSAVLWGVLALVCMMLLCMPAYANEQESGLSGYQGGPGVAQAADGEIVARDFAAEEAAELAAVLGDVPADEAAGAAADGGTVEMEGADGTVYVHDGVSYQKGEQWGDTHRLTGYSGEQLGNQTASGRIARENHTVAASSELPFGTVIIVEGVKGPYPADYNGVYVVEDRGGAKVEGGLIDFYFEKHADAARVTDQGWNSAKVWIAVPAET